MLSVATICKNEMPNVQGFVSSWSEVADEIIIVDTGSKDGTLALLRAMELTNPKLRIYTHEWQQDFSAARNYASSLCLGTWILWADMDDRIHLDSIPRIRELVRTRDCAYAFQIASDVGDGNWHRFMQVRMFPNLPSLKFYGVIHETLDIALKNAELPVFADENVMVAHLGYADENTKKQKAVRNLDLLLHHGEPTTASQFAQVGDSLYVLGKFSVGLGYYEQAVRLGGKEAKDKLAEKLLVGYLMRGQLDKAHELAFNLERSCIARDYWLGEISRSQGHFSSAKLHFERALKGTRDLSKRECNGDAMIKTSMERLKELEALCVLA